MAIQVTNTLDYNYGTYTQPYFRLTLHYPVAGTQVPVDCFMYPSKQAFLDGASSIACWPFYVDTAEAPEMETGYTVVDKYLYYVTTKVKESLEASYPSSTFEITGIPTEAPVVVEPTVIVEQVIIEEVPVEETSA
jgi:hypothetical protein